MVQYLQARPLRQPKAPTECGTMPHPHSNHNQCQYNNKNSSPPETRDDKQRALHLSTYIKEDFKKLNSGAYLNSNQCESRCRCRRRRGWYGIEQERDQEKEIDVRPDNSSQNAHTLFYVVQSLQCITLGLNIGL